MQTAVQNDRFAPANLRNAAKTETQNLSHWEKSAGRNDLPSPEYLQFLKAWLQAYVPAEWPIGSRAMYELRQELAAFEAACESAQDNGSERPAPSPSFWGARREAARLCIERAPDLAAIPEPAELVKQGVSHHQIAKTWCLIRPDGYPDTVRLTQELANPGSVLTPEYRQHVEDMRQAEIGMGPLAKPWSPNAAAETQLPAEDPIDELAEPAEPVAELPPEPELPVGGIPADHVSIEWLHYRGDAVSSIAGKLATKHRVPALPLLIDAIAAVVKAIGTSIPRSIGLNDGIDALVLDGANCNQIASVKARQYGQAHTWPWSAAAGLLADAMKVKLPASSQETLNEAGAAEVRRIYGRDMDHPADVYVRPRMEEIEVDLSRPGEEQAATEEPADVNQRVAELFEAGNDVAAIARDLKMSPKAVKQIINKIGQAVAE